MGVRALPFQKKSPFFTRLSVRDLGFGFPPDLLLALLRRFVARGRLRAGGAEALRARVGSLRVGLLDLLFSFIGGALRDLVRGLLLAASKSPSTAPEGAGE